jgi:23S rRNA (guanosine2251-2'-O)-methyltransferase
MTEFVHGIHSTRALLASEKSEPEKLLLKEGKLGPRLREIEARARELGCPVEFRDKASLDELTDHHQGVVLYVSTIVQALSLEAILGAPRTSESRPWLFVLLDGITDPGNLGACIRSAATFGADAVLVPRDNSAWLTPGARKSASGGTEVIPCIQVTNVGRCLDELKEVGCWAVGTVLDGGQPPAEIDMTGGVVLVMGAEDSGLRRKTRERCDFLCTIPMLTTAMGLNVSVATGITLYEVARQRALASDVLIQ